MTCHIALNRYPKFHSVSSPYPGSWIRPCTQFIHWLIRFPNCVSPEAGISVNRLMHRFHRLPVSSSKESHRCPRAVSQQQRRIQEWKKVGSNTPASANTSDDLNFCFHNSKHHSKVVCSQYLTGPNLPPKYPTWCRPWSSKQPVSVRQYFNRSLITAAGGNYMRGQAPSPRGDARSNGAVLPVSVLLWIISLHYDIA